MILDQIIGTDHSGSYEKLSKWAPADRYAHLSTENIRAKIAILESKKSALLESEPFDKKAGSGEYGSTIMKIGALKNLLEAKSAEASARPLVAGAIYYRDCKVIGNWMVGDRCTYLGEGRAAWSKFAADVRVEKAMLLLRSGSDQDVREIYVSMADGRRDPLGSPSVRHVAESSDSALRKIGRYCDDRWEGPWPWEVHHPTKLGKIMEMKAMKRNKRLAELRMRISADIAQLYEGELEKSEVVIAGKEMSDKLTAMIHELGKLSAQMMSDFKDQVRSQFGKNAISGLDQVYNDKITGAVDTLSDTKSALDEYLKGLSTGGSDMGMGSPDMGDLGDLDTGAGPGSEFMALGDMDDISNPDGEDPFKDLDGDAEGDGDLADFADFDGENGGADASDEPKKGKPKKGKPKKEREKKESALRRGKKVNEWGAESADIAEGNDVGLEAALKTIFDFVRVSDAAAYVKEDSLSESDIEAVEEAAGKTGFKYIGDEPYDPDTHGDAFDLDSDVDYGTVINFEEAVGEVEEDWTDAKDRIIDSRRKW